MISFYKKNIINIFLKNILIVSAFFFSLVLILNILEEVTFFKDMEVNLAVPIFLTILNSPSILFEIFPFIFLIGAMGFFIELLNKNELIIYKSYGLSNLDIIGSIISAAFILGVLLVLLFYNISSNLKFLYLDNNGLLLGLSIKSNARRRSGVMSMTINNHNFSNNSLRNNL
mgnify:CR=1 FL=1